MEADTMIDETSTAQTSTAQTSTAQTSSAPGAGSTVGVDRSIRVDGTTVTLERVVVEEPALARLLSSRPPEVWEDTVRRVLAVGAQGVLSMGLGIDLGDLDSRVRASVHAASAELHQQVDTVLTEARRAFAEHLDPDHRTSAVARALAEFGAWRDDFLAGLDPDRSSSHTARLVGELRGLVGRDGLLEARIRELLDPDADDSGLGRLQHQVDRRFTELRDLVVAREAHDAGRAEEAERGSRKGVDFEDVVEMRLREAARTIGGCTVERTALESGGLAAKSRVGDFVVSLPNGRRVVVEAKNTNRIGLTGSGGILDELERACANRRADFAVCVSAQNAFPQEVGPFGVYGHKVLVVDDGDGTMTAVALRWAAAMLDTSGVGEMRADPAVVGDRLQRLQDLAKLFSTNRRALTEVTTSVENVQSSLKQMRNALLELVEDLAAELVRAPARAAVIPLNSVG